MTDAVPSVLLALGALAAAALGAFVLRSTPKGAFAVWTGVLFFVPVWVGVTVGIFWSGIVLITIALLVVNSGRVPLHPADGWVGAFAAIVLGLLVLGGVGLPAAVSAILEWVVPYCWGRLVLARVSPVWIIRTVALMAVVAASLAIAEFVTSVNPFVLIPGTGVPYEDWSPLQERAGIQRAEGAFGHSIALGASMAISSAFVVAAPWRPVPKLVAVGLLTAATVFSFSRAGLVALAVTLALSICLLPGVSRRFRAMAVGTAIIGIAVIVPLLDSVFGAAGDEAAGSAGYRTDLLVLLRHVELFGNPGDWSSLVSGDHYLGFFADSIDNALLLMLLRFGYIPTLLLFAAILCALLPVIRREQRNPAAIAVAGQLPSLLVVALITQYGVFLWFCIGLAVAWGQVREGTRPVDSRLTRVGTDSGVQGAARHG